MTASHPAHPTIPGNIHVERDRLGSHTRLTIDGEPFVYAIAGDGEGVHVELASDMPPSVRLTLVAKSVTVSDRLMEGVDLPDHDHAPEPAPEPEAEAGVKGAPSDGVDALRQSAQDAALVPSAHRPIWEREIDGDMFYGACEADGQSWPCPTEVKRAPGGR